MRPVGAPRRDRGRRGREVRTFSDMQRVALVTGATDGIGRASAAALAGAGLHVLVHGRTRARAERVAGELREAGRSAEGVVADLGRLDDVRALAHDLLARGGPLHVVVVNAGVFAERRRETADGHERTFQVNYLSQALLVVELLPLLRRSAPSRVLLTSSITHRSVSLDLRDLENVRAYSPYGAYAASKLALILFARALARRLAGTGVTVNAFHPGVIATKLLSAGYGAGVGGGAPEAAARLVLRLATDPALEGVTGRYFEHGRDTEPAPQARDDALADALLDRTLEALGAPAIGVGGAMGGA
jgi:NAD(P)-dependent dehydrogenase (short-subunit alcohol dehydrogenase family)